MKWLIIISSFVFTSFVHANIKHIARFEHHNKISYGEVLGDAIQPLSGKLFGNLKAVGQLLPLSEVQILLPTEPQKVFAVGMVKHLLISLKKTV